jgi:hypothetical protein
MAMTIIQCPRDQYTQITTVPVTSFSFNIRNPYPDPLNKCVWRITYGDTLPAPDNNDYIVTVLDHGNKVFSRTIDFTNDLPMHVFLCPINSDGSVAI